MRNPLSLLLLMFIFNANAQGYSSLTTEQFMHNAVKRGSMELEIENTEGNPFLYDKWFTAEVYSSSEGKVFIIDSVNYLATKDWFLFKKNKDFFQIYPEKVTLIVLRDGDKRYFFMSMPWNKGLQLPVFAEIFTNDPKKALVFVQYKRYQEPKNKSQSYASDKTLHEYVLKTRKRIYIKVNGDLVTFNGNFRKLAKILKADKNTLKKLAQENRLNIKDPKDLQKFLEIFYAKEAK